MNHWENSLSTGKCEVGRKHDGRFGLVMTLRADSVVLTFGLTPANMNAEDKICIMCFGFSQIFGSS